MLWFFLNSNQFYFILFQFYMKTFLNKGFTFLLSSNSTAVGILPYDFRLWSARHTSQRDKVHVRNGPGNVWIIRVNKYYILDTLKNSWTVQNLLPKALCGMRVCNEYMCAYVSVSVVCMRMYYSASLYIQALSWQFWEEFGVLSLCYHDVLCQTQLLHSVHSTMYARSPSSMWEPRDKLRSPSSCLSGASIHGAWPRTGPLNLQPACQRPCSHASEHRVNHTHNQNKLPSSAWFMYLFWEEICLTTRRRKSDAFKHRSEKHIIIRLVCMMACSWTDGPEDVLS